MAKCQRKGLNSSTEPCSQSPALPITICVVWKEWLSFSWLHLSICKLSKLCSLGLWAPLCCQQSCTGGSLRYLCFRLLHLLHASLAACSLLRSVLGLPEPASLSSENGNTLEFTALPPVVNPEMDNMETQPLPTSGPAGDTVASKLSQPRPGSFPSPASSPFFSACPRSISPAHQWYPSP